MTMHMGLKAEPAQVLFPVTNEYVLASWMYDVIPWNSCMSFCLNLVGHRISA